MQIIPNGYNPLELDSDKYIAVNTDVEDLNAERAERMTRVISKFSSAITSRVVNVSVVNDKQVNLPSADATAWSDAENIWFNIDKLGDLNDPDTALAIKGVSLHELGHIQLTPRAGSNLVKWVRGNNFERAFNILEDQRTELFLSTKYSNVKHWFTAAVTKYLIDNPQAIPNAFPLIHGRSFLPAELRQAIRSAYANQSIANQLASIIDRYTVLNLSDSVSIPIAQQLIREFHELIASTGQGWSDVPNPDKNGSGAIMKSSEKSKPMNKAGQDRIIDKINKERGNQQSNPSGDEEGEEYEPSDEPSDEPGEDGEGESSDGDAPKQHQLPQSDGNPGKQAGEGVEGATNNVTQVAQKHLNNAKQILREDLQDMVAQFNGESSLTSKHQKTPERSYYEREVAVPVDVVTQVKSFVNQLELIRAEHDPGWKRRVSAGKLNVYRYMTGAEPDEVFDLWDEGREDVVDIETVVLLDNSGSMGWTIDSAHDSMWAIKRAMDKIGASTTVVTFADDARILYGANQKAKVTKAYVGVAGGTNPKQAVDYAKYILANSERAIKILIVITDGEWWNSEEQDRIISQMRKAGVITALGYIDPRGAWSEENRQRFADDRKQQVNGHGAEIVVALDNGNSLLNLAKALVKAGIKRNLSK